MKEKWQKHKTIYTLFLVLTFLFYGNTLRNKYSLDDEYITVTNLPIKGQKFIPNNNLVKDGFKSIPKIWVSRYAHDGESSFDYRPVVTTTFAIEYGIFGQNPTVSHLINVILYFFLICILYDVLAILFKNEKQHFFLAFVTTLLFLIHPIHTEVVNNLKCRDELLACTFSLLALKNVFSILEKPTIKAFVLIITFLFLAYFSKLSAVLLMAAIPLMIVFYKKVGIKKTAFTIVGLIILYKLFQIFSNSMPTEELVRNYYRFENPMYTEKFTFFEKLWIGIKTFGFYIQLLIFPFPLRFYYGSNMFDFSITINGYFITSIVFVFACAFYYWKKRDNDFLFAFLLLGLLMVPYLNILETVAGILADRLMFIPSIGFCIMIAVLLKSYYENFNFNKFSDLLAKPLVYLMPVILISAVYTISRNTNWNTKLSLFEHDITYLTKSAKANSLLGNEYFEMLRSPNKKYPDQFLTEKCLKHYSTAVTNDSSFFSAYNNAGVVYFSFLNDVPNAKKHFTLGIRHKPLYAQAYENLGNCYKQEKNISEAFKCYKKAILIKPKEFSTYITCFNLYFETKDYKKAKKFLKVAQSVFPNNYELTAQEANCYIMMNQLKEAIEKYEEAYKIFPNTNLARYISTQALKQGDTTLYRKYLIL